MPNVEATIITFDIFCKAGSKMLLDLHHDFADARGDFVRKSGAIVMPKEEKPTIKPDMTGAAREAGARVPDRPDYSSLNEIPPPKSLDEFAAWSAQYVEKAHAVFEGWAVDYSVQEADRARRDLMKDLGTRPSAALGIR